MRFPILFLLLTVVAMAAKAQFYNSGAFYVSSGTTLVTGGNFTNTASANYKNDGTVYISGNARNDQAALPAGAGTTWFNGASAQTVNGAAPLRGFNVVLNNVAGLSLLNRLAIGDGTGGSLTFQSGLITAGSNTQDVYFYPGSGYTGFDDNHHIIGYVTKSGTTDFNYPIGDGTHQAALTLSSLSGAADLQVLYHGTGFGTYTTTPPLATGGAFGSEWWDIAETAGTATAAVTLHWNDARKPLNHLSPSTLVVAHFTGGSWQSVGGSSSDPAGSSTGSIGPSNAVGSFSPFTFGSTTTALPIVLGSFEVMNKDCSADLSWETQLEQNASGFEVQQSPDGAAYTTVAFVKAKGQPSVYHVAVPQEVQQGWYRIRMVDLDGSFVYSSVVSLQLPCLNLSEGLALYPNPLSSDNDLTVKYTAPKSCANAMVEIYDMTGRKVYNGRVQVNKGINIYHIPAASLTGGSYTVVVRGDGWRTDGAGLIKK